MADPSLRGVCRIAFAGVSPAGQSVTCERYPGNQWVATLWEQGLPVSRRPVAEPELLELLRRFPFSVS